MSNATNLQSIIFISLISIMLSGCASLSKEQCLLGDWQAIGYTDGVKGFSASRIGKHQKACSKVSVSPKYQEWAKGRTEGLKEYCTQSNAYQLGKNGKDLNNVCPKKIAYTLHQVNKKGQAIYQLQHQIEKDKKKLNTSKKTFNRWVRGEFKGCFSVTNHCQTGVDTTQACLLIKKHCRAHNMPMFATPIKARWYMSQLNKQINTLSQKLFLREVQLKKMNTQAY